MRAEFSGLSPEQINDVLAFRARVRSSMEAERRQPTGQPTCEEIGEFIFFSWKEATTSIGVEIWLKEHSMEPVRETDLHVLRNRGLSRHRYGIIALGDEGPDIYLLSHSPSDPATITITKTERVAGSKDDLWYPGWDWIADTIFPARSKK